MKEAVSGYLVKLARKTEDPVTHRATMPNGTLKGPLENNYKTQQENEHCHASCAIEKNKKYHIPFIALALVLLLASFCVISMVGLRPVALANKLTLLDGSPTPSDSNPTPSNMAIVNLHAAVGYPDVTIGGQTSTFTLVPQGENDPASFRGIVVPISRWGCIANDFVALVSNKFWTDMAGFVPFVGGLAKFIGNVFNAIDVAKHVGEFVVLILSIMLCTQVFMRVVLLNYYVLTGPLAFGCWGLPGGVGQKVVSSWTKGFLSLLFTQTAQIFVLATFPLILPAFPSLPTDRFGLLNILFEALPRILILTATLAVPKVMGTGATKAIAQAGTVVGGAVAAAGAAAYSAV